MRERKRLENQLAMDDELVRRMGDIEAYFELAREGESIEPELQREIESLGEFVEQLETRTMLGGETDALNAIVTVHPGAGGTESQDWADMLLRMYLRWAERQGFHGYRRIRLWPALRRDRSSPPGADLSFRSGQAPPHFLRERLCFTRD
jgi:protein subunit release factor A